MNEKGPRDDRYNKDSIMARTSGRAEVTADIGEAKIEEGRVAWRSGVASQQLTLVGRRRNNSFIPLMEQHF